VAYILPAKAPTEVSDYAISFEAVAGGASISAHTLAVAAQPNGSAAIASQSLAGYVMTASFSGGAAGIPTVFDLGYI